MDPTPLEEFLDLYFILSSTGRVKKDYVESKCIEHSINIDAFTARYNLRLEQTLMAGREVNWIFGISKISSMRSPTRETRSTNNDEVATIVSKLGDQITTLNEKDSDLRRKDIQITNLQNTNNKQQERIDQLTKELLIEKDKTKALEKKVVNITKLYVSANKASRTANTKDRINNASKLFCEKLHEMKNEDPTTLDLFITYEETGNKPRNECEEADSIDYAYYLYNGKGFDPTDCLEDLLDTQELKDNHRQMISDLQSSILQKDYYHQLKLTTAILTTYHTLIMKE